VVPFVAKELSGCSVHDYDLAFEKLIDILSDGCDVTGYLITYSHTRTMSLCHIVSELYLLPPHWIKY